MSGRSPAPPFARLVALVFVVASLASAAALWPSRQASACSGDGAAAMAAVPLVVAARVIAVGAPLPDRNALVTLHVDRYLRGTGPASVDVLTTGAGSSCYTGPQGAGKYYVGGLAPSADGSYRFGLFTTFAWGAGPDDPEVMRGVRSAEGVVRNTPLIPARVGNAGLADAREARSGGRDGLEWTAALATLVLVAAARARSRVPGPLSLWGERGCGEGSASR